MKRTRYLLIGGGLASARAVRQIRRHDPDGAITLVGEEPQPPYDRPPLSKEFLRGQKPRQELFLEPEGFYQDNGVELVLGTRVTNLDAVGKRANLSTGEEVAFEKALLATGGRPIRLGIPGADLPGVFYLRTLEDSEAIAEAAREARRAVVVGAGFIGLEVASSLAQMGLEVTAVEAGPHVWPRFADETLARFFQDYCAQRGVRFHLGEPVSAFEGRDRVSAVVTASGRRLEADLVCVGVGIRPNVELAREAGLEVDDGVVVNERFQTSHPDIYAVGDVANYPDPVFGKRRRVEHWGHAEYSGQVAGQNMAGGDATYDLLTYVWSDIFDLHLEFAGDESERDTVLVRGRMEDASFTVLFLEGGRLKAYFAVNTPSREFPVFQRLIRRRIDLRDRLDQLADPDYNVRQLLR